MTQTAVQTPLDKMRQSFPLAHEKSNGWWTHDDNPRFDFLETEDGTIRIHSHTGRTAETILSMGQPPLKLADLYPKGNFKPQYREKQFDLLTLAEYLKLDWQFLFNLGYRDGYTYKNRMGRRSVCVKIGGYYMPDGVEHSKVKVRLSTDGNVRFLWDQNTPGDPIPCGLHRLCDARRAGHLIIGEGESDFATMQFHGFPFLGISGADGHKSLDVSLLRDIPRIYIIEEPDQAKKNNETGQGFYTNLRTHLRDNGYTGEIFSIRFQLATGYKDPSNMHKSIVRFCQLEDEKRFTATVKEQFAAKMAKAINLAIPEGNTAIATQEDIQEVQRPPITENDLLQWIKELLAVESSVLSPAHKMTLMVIMLYSPIWNEKGEFWWKVDAAQLGIHAGMDKKTFLKNLAYLTKKIGLFEKRHVRIWSSPGESPVKKCRTELSIRPKRTAQTLYSYPSTYHLVDGAEERNHGGTRIPKPKCERCGKENLDIDEIHHCRDCNHIRIIHKVVEPEMEQEEEEENQVESTAEVLPLENTIKNTTADPNLGIITPIYNEPQVEIVTSEENTTADPIMGSSTVFKKERIPEWLEPGTREWDKQVARNGIKDMQYRRRAWLEQAQERRAS